MQQKYHLLINYLKFTLFHFYCKKIWREKNKKTLFYFRTKLFNNLDKQKEDFIFAILVVTTTAAI